MALRASYPAGAMPSGAWATYRFRTSFRAPLPFVFRWCTDYRSDDARREGEVYRRKVLVRSPRRVVYEDLDELPDGAWFWTRHVVTLEPPDHWHSESIGNRREYRLDYRLRELDDGRTELVFVGRRRPTGLGAKNPTAASFQREMERGWTKFRTELERDYRKAAGKRRRGRSA